jgi:hypothetical protein
MFEAAVTQGLVRQPHFGIGVAVLLEGGRLVIIGV